MGRHATPSPDAHRTRGQRFLDRAVTFVERLVVAVAAGGAVAAVLHWSGSTWTTAWWVGAGVALLVLVASWLASTVPQRPQR